MLKNRLANTTFERYFVEDKETHKEVKDIYYQLINDENIVNKIFKMFGIESENAHIINDHVPIHHTEGESPIKCNGKEIRENIKDLKELIQAYRNGTIRQNQRP